MRIALVRDGSGGLGATLLFNLPQLALDVIGAGI
jgi:hypothetical protein